MISLGIYEKALPRTESWVERLKMVRDLGFNFLELSVDESDERLARLDWTAAKRAKVRDACWQTGVRIHTLMLSGHRRFPLGSADPAIREKSLTMLCKAIDLASDLGVRNVQLAGYDVYYEPKTLASREYFIENLKRGVAYAAAKEVMLAIETMDDPFLNSLSKIKTIKDEIPSPWLQAYPDLGNLSAWPENNVGRELRTLKRLDYSGAFTIEMWTEKAADPIQEVKQAKDFFDPLFVQAGFVQEPVAKTNVPS